MEKANYTTSKIPPHNLEAEQAVLASIILDERALDKIINFINKDDFYHPYHKLIYGTLIELSKENKPLDLITLVSKLEDKNKLAEAGDYSYISSLVEMLPNASNIFYYAEVVKEKSLLRKLINISREISEKSYTCTGNIDELLDELEKNVFKLSEYKLSDNMQPLGNLIEDALHSLETVYQNQGSTSGLPTSYIDLDKLIEGFQPGDFAIVAGRPSMGKTAFAINIAVNIASKLKKSVAIFSLEMSARQLVQRIISSEARINSTKLKNGSLSLEEWQNLAAVGSNLSELKLFIDDTPAVSVMEIRGKCRRLKREYGLDLIIIDYLQLMGGSRADNREQQISEISRSIKSLAKELDVPIIALSQLNRSVEARTDKRPYPSDLRESGAIEQDADLILFLYRDEVYNKDTKLQGIAEIIVSKHRNGPTGTAYLAFIKECTRFENAALEGIVGS
ncbi:MAG: replicative DNA helicase [Deferribacterota bacterium]|nr:replicative DNA helicase [Deferribacterota bacterium]